jgi:phosphatidate phosphatase APP1
LGTIRRYAGSSVPGAAVRLDIGGQNKLLTADDEGVFEILLDLIGDRPKSVNEVRLSLLPEEGIKPEKKFINQKVLRFPKRLPRAVISDIDDTIIVSKATNIQEKFWLSISKNAYTRRPFPGVSDFYRILSANGAYPVFYVSSSDWNLFDLIKDFINYREIPEGPIFLKDQHLDLKNIWKSGGGSHEHKLEKISFLMNFFPKLNFVLIGDSGQHDPEIYGEIIDKFKNRIEAVFIRQVGKTDPARKRKLNGLLPDNKIFWVKNSKEAIAHAKAHLVVDG